MSKAFTRESDEDPDLPVRTGPAGAVPLGAKNYLTEQGAVRLRQELERSLEVDRPSLAARADDPDAKYALRRLDARILHLQNVLRTAEIVPAPVSSDGRIQFGATVTVRQPDGELENYRIVGVDEVDIANGSISWLCPMAKALLNSAVGAKVRCKRPLGDAELKIVAVKYE